MGNHKFSIDGKDYEVSVGARRGNRVEVTVNGTAYDVDLKSAVAAAAIRSGQAVPSPAAPAVGSPQQAPPSAARPKASNGGAGTVVAPMAGLVLNVKVKVGQSVAAGDELLVLEAMKMENAITAPTDGTVSAVGVQPQQTVAQGDLLVEIG